MRMEAIAVSIPFLAALLPSLFPRWRSALMAAVCFYGLLVAGFVLILKLFGATNEEGPAFFGLMLIFGLSTFILLFAFAVRMTIFAVLTSANCHTASALRRLLIGGGLLFACLALVGALEFSLHRGFAVMLGSGSVWLVLVTWLMPNNSFKPSPLRGLGRAP